MWAVREERKLSWVHLGNSFKHCANSQRFMSDGVLPLSPSSQGPGGLSLFLWRALKWQRTAVRGVIGSTEQLGSSWQLVCERARTATSVTVCQAPFLTLHSIVSCKYIMNIVISTPSYPSSLPLSLQIKTLCFCNKVPFLL